MKANNGATMGNGTITAIGRLSKDVFDFEPAIFMGKQGNGKYAREVLRASTTVGMWCSVTGAVLIIIRL